MKNLLKIIIDVLKNKKLIVAVVGLLPVIGIAVSPTFAEHFAEQLAMLLQMCLDLLPAEAVNAAVSPAG